MTPEDRQRLDALLVILEELKRDVEGKGRQIEGLEKVIREMLEKNDERIA